MPQNMVRKSFDYDYYYKDGTKEATDDYRGHICKPSSPLTVTMLTKSKIIVSMTFARTSCAEAT
jgi:hypothetical protein